MADQQEVEDGGAKKRTFRKFSYRGVDLDQLLEIPIQEFLQLTRSRIRRKFARGLKRKHYALNKKLNAAKKDVKVGEKPPVVKTHLRNHVIVPEMIGSVVGVYNGKLFNAVEIKPEMIGHYLGEFSLAYKPCRHGRPGLATGKFIPLK
eukprot:c47950_g1_i1.p1 GENE.c47950_g1_i1~~c47950_g1_i1.p1  ORF type:complete len:148 (-),score=15.35 c47950_g1_i1:11-454(-)